MSLMMGLSSVLLVNSLSQVVITVSVLMPFSVCFLYKTLTYVEANGFMFSTLGVVLVFLTLSLLVLIVLVSEESANSYYIMLQVVLGVLLIVCFCTNNLVGFYIMFEACLVPILLMIITWGYQPERLQAGLYMVMYTVVSSMPLLVIIMCLCHKNMTYHLASLFSFSYNSNGVLLLGCAAFVVKLPVYGLHIWLPKAHVEAPLGGSMVLAGVLLKLGGYGLYLYNALIDFMWSLSFMGLLLILLTLWGGCLASVACIQQVDIKALIAYSSIVHMSFITLGVLSNTTWGFYSACVIMVAHGWCSSGMFLLAFITYQFVGSRSFSYTKGMLAILPVLSLMWFLLSIINMGFPPTINFLGEVLIVPASMLYSWKIFLILGGVMFMSVAYNMYLYCQVNHGAVSNLITNSKNPLSARKLLTVFGHFMPLVLVINMSLLLSCK